MVIQKSVAGHNCTLILTAPRLSPKKVILKTKSVRTRRSCVCHVSIFAPSWYSKGHFENLMGTCHQAPPANTSIPLNTTERKVTLVTTPSSRSKLQYHLLLLLQPVELALTAARRKARSTSNAPFSTIAWLHRPVIRSQISRAKDFTWFGVKGRGTSSDGVENRAVPWSSICALEGEGCIHVLNFGSTARIDTKRKNVQRTAAQTTKPRKAMYEGGPRWYS
jgi:hypothetical protein